MLLQKPPVLNNLAKKKKKNITLKHDKHNG